MLYTAVYASFYQSGIPLVGYGNLWCTRWVKTRKAMRFSRGDHLEGLAVWLSGNALASINVVALRQTRLVPGWVTICGRVNHLGM